MPPELRFDCTVYVTIHGREDEIYATCRLTKTPDRRGSGDRICRLPCRRSTSPSANWRGASSRDARRYDRAARTDGYDARCLALRLSALSRGQAACIENRSAAPAGAKVVQTALTRHDRFSSMPAWPGCCMEWPVHGAGCGHRTPGRGGSLGVQARDSDPNSGRAMRELGFVALIMTLCR